MWNYLIKNWFDEDNISKKSIIEGFGEAICDVAKNDKSIIVLNADLPRSLKVQDFEKNFPDRFIQVGIAEQNMAGIATGMALYGKTPFITSFAAFSPAMNYSQLRLAAISNCNLKIIGSHYGLSIGEDGATAQMLEDIGLMKTIPGITILNPADYKQIKQTVYAMIKIKGMVYMRPTRSKFPVYIDDNEEYSVGKAQRITEGNGITILATGSILYEVLMAVKELITRDKISVELFNIHTIKPIDESSIIKSVKKTGKIVIIEEHNIFGGMSEIVSRILLKKYPVKSEYISINDKYGESGEHYALWEKYGLDRKSIYKKIKSFYRKCNLINKN